MSRRQVGAVSSTITKIMTVQQLLDYLIEAGYDTAEYLAEGGRKILRWCGEGAAAVGLEGAAEVDAAGALLRGVDPEQLDGTGLVAAASRTLLGSELSFGPPKSVSTYWAISGAAVRAEIDAAVVEAIAAAVAVLDERVAWTRVRAGRGDLRWVRGEGLLAMAVRHDSSRAGDPQIHDHLLIANMTRAEGQWRALDGQLLYEARPLATSAYGRTLQRELTRRLGVAWSAPTGRNSIREILGVPAVLTGLYAKRHAEVLAAVAAQTKKTGVVGGGGARRVAAATTRATKDLSEAPEVKRARWRAEAVAVLVASRARGDSGGQRGAVAAAVAAALWAETGGDRDRFAAALDAVVAMEEVPEVDAAAGAAALRAADLIVETGSVEPPGVSVAVSVLGATLDGGGRSVREAYEPREVLRLAEAAQRHVGDSLDVLAEAVGGRAAVAEGWDRRRAAVAACRSITDRATYWGRDELLSTLLEEVPGASFEELDAFADEVAGSDLVEGIAVVSRGGGPDGTGRRPGWELWGTAETMARERAVIDWWAEAASKPWRDLSGEAGEAARRACEAEGLDAEQTEAVVALAGRRGGVLSAPAGAGKTTAMAGLRAAAAPGQAVVALATGEMATQEIEKSAGVHATNLAAAMSLADRADKGRDVDAADRALPYDGVWIVDEGSTVDTVMWEKLLRRADERGAAVDVIGDPEQLDSVDPGGVYEALVARPDIPSESLETVRRFHADWEAEASLRLRVSDAAVLDTYADCGRIVGVGEDTTAGDAVDEIAAMWVAAAAQDPPAGEITPGVRRIWEMRAAKREKARGLLADLQDAAGAGAEDAIAAARDACEAIGCSAAAITDRLVPRTGGAAAIADSDLEGADVLSTLVTATTHVEVDALNAKLRDVDRALRGAPPVSRDTAIDVAWSTPDGDDRTWRFCVGDTVMTTRNARSTRTTKRRGVTNGRRWRITAISGTRLRLESLDGEGRVELRSSYWARCDRRTGRPSLSLGYASTVYKAQGRTVDAAMGLSGPALDAPGLYVAMTRGRWGSILVGEGSDEDVIEAAEAALGRPGHLTAASEMHRLGVEAGGEVAQRPRGPTLSF